MDIVLIYQAERLRLIQEQFLIVKKEKAAVAKMKRLSRLESTAAKRRTKRLFTAVDNLLSSRITEMRVSKIDLCQFTSRATRVKRKNVRKGRRDAVLTIEKVS